MNHRIDDDPPPRRSPQLRAEVGAIPHARKASEVIGTKTSNAKKRRLQVLSIVHACREHVPPVPVSTLVCILGISARNVMYLQKLGRRKNKRRDRV
jgi:hypothetical protein